MISDLAREKIEIYLDGFIDGLTEKFTRPEVIEDIKTREFKDASSGNLKPFHEAIIPEELMRLQGFFRSFSTSLGAGVFEPAARIIAEDNKSKFLEVKSRHRIEAILSSQVHVAIGNITDALERGLRPPNLKEELEAINRAVRETTKGEGEKVTIIADLYVKDKDEHKFYFEIKSPKPNKDQTKETKAKFLRIRALVKSPVSTIYAMPYNPYGTKGNYKWSFPKNFFELDKELLIGKEFWDFLGGPGTYEELLDIFAKVGKEKGPELIDKLVEA